MARQFTIASAARSMRTIGAAIRDHEVVILDFTDTVYIHGRQHSRHGLVALRTDAPGATPGGAPQNFEFSHGLSRLLDEPPTERDTAVRRDHLCREVFGRESDLFHTFTIHVMLFLDSPAGETEEAKGRSTRQSTPGFYWGSVGWRFASYG